MKLFKKYQLEVKTPVSSSYYISAKNKDNIILAQFIDFWRCSKDIKEDLLPDLNLVLIGEKKEDDIGADVVGWAFCKKDVTEIIMSDVGYKDMELPTEDFHGLILEWVEFLESQGR